MVFGRGCDVFGIIVLGQKYEITLIAVFFVMSVLHMLKSYIHVVNRSTRAPGENGCIPP